MLYPIPTPKRDRSQLSGFWKASVDLKHGLPKFWEVPVPSSINEFLPEEIPQDFIGDVWYETEFYFPFLD